VQIKFPKYSTAPTVRVSATGSNTTSHWGDPIDFTPSPSSNVVWSIVLLRGPTKIIRMPLEVHKEWVPCLLLFYVISSNVREWRLGEGVALAAKNGSLPPRNSTIPPLSYARSIPNSPLKGTREHRRDQELPPISACATLPNYFRQLRRAGAGRGGSASAERTPSLGTLGPDSGMNNTSVARKSSNHMYCVINPLPCLSPITEGKG